MTRWQDLNRQITLCRQCPRLIAHCEKVAIEKRKAYQDEEYWGLPVPNLGSSRVPLLIVGLAPGAHGANRTGRMFTGDRSGEWLYRAMFRAGFCNQAQSTHRDDGLRLRRCAVTNICHCAPPENRPTGPEIRNCAEFLDQTIALVRPRLFLALGGLAWNALTTWAQDQGHIPRPRPKFGHGARVQWKSARGATRWLVGCYHPSQQNTFTGKLTESMLDDLFAELNEMLASSD